jgi:hypothetical protein
VHCPGEISRPSDDDTWSLRRLPSRGVGQP